MSDSAGQYYKCDRCGYSPRFHSDPDTSNSLTCYQQDWFVKGFGESRKNYCKPCFYRRYVDPFKRQSSLLDVVHPYP